MILDVLFEDLHARALDACLRYRRIEAELVDVLIQVEGQLTFLERGHASLFSYVTSELGLSESAAYALITVSRKVREVPELGVRFRRGEITLSKARRVASVLTASNQEEWLERACKLSTRALEREIARVRPETKTTEEASYAGLDRIQLKVGLSESQMLKLRHAQDLLCQSRRRAVSLEETIGVMTGEFLRRKDPVARARRQTARRGSPSVTVEKLVTKPSVQVGGLVTKRSVLVDGLVANPSAQVGGLVAPLSNPHQLGAKKSVLRVPIPASIQHTVNLRDQRRCTQVLANGARCNQRRWTDIHHIQPVYEGGENTPQNLTTLCYGHHRLRHLKQGKRTDPTQIEVERTEAAKSTQRN